MVLRRQGPPARRRRLVAGADGVNLREQRQARAQPRDDIGELGIMDEDGRVAVGEDVAQLVAGVAIVDVDVDQPRLERRDRHLGIGRAIAQQQRDLIARARSAGEEGRGERVGAPGEVAPRRHAAVVDQRRIAGRNRRRHPLEHLAEARHRPSPSPILRQLDTGGALPPSGGMRAMICQRLSDDRSGLVVTADAPEPSPPGPGEVTVAVAYAGLNYPDVLMLAGRYQYAPPLPFTPGVEGSGTVIAVGDGVDPGLVGRCVVVGARSGLLAERVTVPAAAVRPCPVGLSLAEGAGFTVAALTAYVALVRRGGLVGGERVLVAGAAGGTGLAAVALATALGASVTGLASTPQKATAAVTAGAVGAIVARRGQAPALPPCDLVFDPVGGPSTAALLAALVRGGRYLVVGFVGGIAPVATADLTARELSVIGVRAGEFARRDPAAGAENLAAIDALAIALRPHIGCRVPLEEADRAFAAMADGTLIGKAVIACGA